jgi:hypothetical protein
MSSLQKTPHVDGQVRQIFFIERGVRLPPLQVRHARGPLALLRHAPALNLSSDQTMESLAWIKPRSEVL